MTLFDYGVLGILGLSVLLSMLHGFLRETLSLAGWVTAFFIAKWYTLALAPLLPQAIPGESLRLLAAFLILFLVTLLVISLVAIVIAELFKKVGLGWLDRWLGALFGLLRGILVAGIIVFLGGLTSLPREPFWRNAMFSPPLEAMVTHALPWLPEGIAKHVKYD